MSEKHIVVEPIGLLREPWATLAAVLATYKTMRNDRGG
jgi:hypothetical protein